MFSLASLTLMLPAWHTVLVTPELEGRSLDNCFSEIRVALNPEPLSAPELWRQTLIRFLYLDFLESSLNLLHGALLRLG